MGVFAYNSSAACYNISMKTRKKKSDPNLKPAEDISVVSRKKPAWDNLNVLLAEYKKGKKILIYVSLMQYDIVLRLLYETKKQTMDVYDYAINKKAAMPAYTKIGNTRVLITSALDDALILKALTKTVEFEGKPDDEILLYPLCPKMRANLSRDEAKKK